MKNAEGGRLGRSNQDKRCRALWGEHVTLIRREHSSSPEGYPEFFLMKGDASQQWTKCVVRIVSTIDFGDPAQFEEAQRRAFRMLKELGLDVIERAVRKAEEQEGPELSVGFRRFIWCLGNLVVEKMTPAERSRFIPFNDVLITPFGHDILVRVSSLRRTEVNGTRVYHSSRCPTLTIDGKKRVVAFTRHAIERLCDRIVPSWRYYTGLGDAYAFFSDCLHFELAELYPKRLAFTFYDSCFLEQCRPGLTSFPCEYARRVIGTRAMIEHRDFGRRWYYRVGYCPAFVGRDFVDGDFVVAKTLLFPGMKTTPEYGLLLESPLSEQERNAMLAKAESQTAETMQKTWDYSLVKWFHDNGVPQVVALEGDIFANGITYGVRHRQSRGS